jgi:hypothetical protein
MAPKRGEDDRVELSSLPPQQLAEIRDRVDSDFDRLAESQAAIHKLISKFNASAHSIEMLASSKEGGWAGVGSCCWSAALPGRPPPSIRHGAHRSGSLAGRQPGQESQPGCVGAPVCAGQPLLLPLTSSLYAQGKVADSKEVLIDIGTGYYVKVGAGIVLLCMECTRHQAA